MTSLHRPFPTAFLLTSALLIAGCSSETSDTPARSAANSAEDDHAHPHPHEADAGHSHDDAPHDGTLADWGGGDYHVELTVNHDNQEATVYILGDDAKTPKPVSTDKLLLTINDPKLQTDLLPAPLDGETAESCSRFTGTHEGLGVVQQYSGIISAEVEGTPYSASFKEEAHGHNDDHEDDHEH